MAEATFAGGFALVGVNKCDDVENGGTCMTLGIPLAARVSAQARVVGVGTELWMNLNPKGPFGRLSLFIQLGWMP